MTKVLIDISTSLDGFVAGPNPTLEQPLGERGEELHEWAFRLASWRAAHGQQGGETGPENDLVAETVRASGATVMGRRMFSGGAGPWADDPNPNGWWGEEPPFHGPVFVLTHHAREPLALHGGTTFTFVTEGIESALEQARAAAGDRAVTIAGGADVAQQSLNAGLVDELQLHLSPVLLGGGTPLFGGVAADRLRLEPIRVVSSPLATHVTYAVGFAA